MALYLALVHLYCLSLYACLVLRSQGFYSLQDQQHSLASACFCLHWVVRDLRSDWLRVLGVCAEISCEFIQEALSGCCFVVIDIARADGLRVVSVEVVDLTLIWAQLAVIDSLLKWARPCICAAFFWAWLRLGGQIFHHIVVFFADAILDRLIEGDPGPAALHTFQPISGDGGEISATLFTGGKEIAIDGRCLFKSWFALTAGLYRKMKEKVKLVIIHSSL